MTMIPPVERNPGAKVLKDDASLTLAESYLTSTELTDLDGRCLLQHWSGDFYVWDESIACYRRQVYEQFYSRAFHYLKMLKVKNKKGRAIDFAPEPRQVRSVLDTLAGARQAHIERMPVWLCNHMPDVADVVSFKNGLLNFREYAHSDGTQSAVAVPLLIPPTPDWFSESVLPYRFNHEATCYHWQQFLASVLPVDRHAGAIDLLQEWFGYCLTADTRHQKMMVMVGPPRCGKGTIIRALQRVIGEDNCASPTFDSLGERFGLEVLIGKKVATIPDAHIGRGSEATRILDKLLQITGEDRVTVDRKGRQAIANMRLGTRFMVACNEPPDLPDASGAIISRFLMLQFRESFVGREDLALEDRLAKEVSGIARWALDGLKRLRRVGRFTQPEDAVRLRNDYLRQTAPIHAFIQDRCEVGGTPDHYVDVEQFWSAWKKWAEANGNHPGSKEGLGKRLRAASAHIVRLRVMRGGVQKYEYAGIKLMEEGYLNFSKLDAVYDEEPNL